MKKKGTQKKSRRHASWKPSPVRTN